MQDCKFYYETTYDISTNSGTVDDKNVYTIAQRTVIVPSGPNRDIDVYATSFDLIYEEKNEAPDIGIYNPTTGTVNSIEAYTWASGSVQNNASITFTNQWTEDYKGKTRCSYIATLGESISAVVGVAGAVPSGSGNIILHATFDSRLGR